jgi:hypothetical protein
MFKHKWTKTLILAGLLVLPASVSMAAVVEMIVIPCLPGQPPDECGVKLSVTEGSATFTSNSGQTTTVTAGTSLTVSGTGVVTQSNGSIVNFAAVAGGTTTGSIGGGGGGAGGPQGPNGGSNTGSSGSSTNSTGSGSGETFALTSGGVTSVGGGPSQPASAH